MACLLYNDILKWGKMEKMEKHSLISGSIADHIKNYIDTKLSLAKVKAAGSASDAISSTITYVALSLLGIFILIFGSFTLGYALGSYFNNYWLGFLIVTLVYILLAVVLWCLKDKLRLPILNIFLKKIKED